MSLIEQCVEIMSNDSLKFRDKKREIKNLLRIGNLPTPPMNQIKWRPRISTW